MGPVTPGSRMRGGTSGIELTALSTSTETESVQVSPSSSVTVSNPRCQPVEEYCTETTSWREVTPSTVQRTEVIFLVPGARQAVQSTVARPPLAVVATATVGFTAATHCG